MGFLYVVTRMKSYKAVLGREILLILQMTYIYSIKPLLNQSILLSAKRTQRFNAMNAKAQPWI